MSPPQALAPKPSRFRLWLGIGIACVAVLPIVTALLPRSPSDQERPSTTDQQTWNPELVTANAHNFIKAYLKDPDSAVFASDEPHALGYFCGVVRSRNTFGGYANPLRYVILPFGLVTSEDQNNERFVRIWNHLCTLPDQSPGIANKNNEIIKDAAPMDRAWMLGVIVGPECSGRSAFFMGAGTSGISAGKAFWSVKCTSGKAFEVEIPPSGTSRILDCDAVRQLPIPKCFTKLK